LEHDTLIQVLILAALVVQGVIIWANQRMNRQQAQQLHVLVNSRMDELLELTRTSSHAEGVLAEKTEAEDRS
jgi:hypothetical protein